MPDENPTPASADLDALGSVPGIPATEPAGSPCALDRAMALVSFLRGHCPWDEAQTPRSLIKHLIEESHEVADAVLRDDGGALREELGDLLLNVAFQIVIARERGLFDSHEVWRTLEEKMKRRHPHLFGGGSPGTWDDIKERESAPRPGALDGLPSTLPPLARANALGRRASRAGFDWDDPAGALEKVREETLEVAERLTSAGGRPSPDQADPGGLEEEIGDLLFAVVNVARQAGVDPHTALAGANLKFIRRFEAVEALAARRGLPMPGTQLEELDRLWDEVKASRG